MKNLIIIANLILNEIVFFKGVNNPRYVSRLNIKALNTVISSFKGGSGLIGPANKGPRTKDQRPQTKDHLISNHRTRPFINGICDTAEPSYF